MHLSNQLTIVMERNNKRLSDIYKATGIPKSTLSRLLRGKQLFVSDEDLEKITGAVCATDTECAEVLRARMLDVCTGRGSNLVSVQIRGEKKEKEPTPPRFGKLAPDVRDALFYLAEYAFEHHDAGNVLIGWAKLMGHKP